MSEYTLSDIEENTLYNGKCPYCKTYTVGTRQNEDFLFKYKKLCIHTSCDKCKEHFSMYFKLAYATTHQPTKGEKLCQPESNLKIIPLSKAKTKKKSKERNPTLNGTPDGKKD